MLQAGLEGIEKNYELPESIEKNLYDLSPGERKKMVIESLPDSLGEAVDLLERSEFMKRTLGEHVFSRFVALKRKSWENYRLQLTEYELDNLLPIL